MHIKIVLSVLLFVLISGGAAAQTDLDETFSNDLFSVDYPSDWVVQTNEYQTEAGEDALLVAFYSSQEVLDAILAGNPDNPAVIPSGGSLTFIQGIVDSRFDPEEAVEEAVANNQVVDFGEAEMLSIGDFEIVGAAYEQDQAEGIYWVFEVGDVLISVSAETPLGEFEDFMPTLEAVVESVRAAGEERAEESDNTDDESLLEYGMSVEGTIRNDDGETWQFEGREGDVVTIAMDAAAGSALDPYLELYGPDGELITEDDDSGGSFLSALIEGFELPEDGIYTIVARTFGGEGRGDYVLTLVEGDEFVGIPMGSLEIGETVEGELPRGGVQIYTFEGEAGEEVTIRMEADDATLDPYLELRDADGDLLAEDDDSGGDLDAEIDDFELPEDGVYTIVVRTFAGEGGGDYTLSLR